MSVADHSSNNYSSLFKVVRNTIQLSTGLDVTCGYSISDTESRLKRLCNKDISVFININNMYKTGLFVTADKLTGRKDIVELESNFIVDITRSYLNYTKILEFVVESIKNAKYLQDKSLMSKALMAGYKKNLNYFVDNHYLPLKVIKVGSAECVISGNTLVTCSEPITPEMQQLATAKRGLFSIC